PTALLDDEEAINKEVADTMKDHKRKHNCDDDDEDDDEGLSAGPNQGKTLTKVSKTGKSASAKESVEEPIAEVIMDSITNTKDEDVIHNEDDRPHDSSEPKTDNLELVQEYVSTLEDSLTFDDLMATPIDFLKYVLNRLKIDNLTQDILIGLAFNLLKGTCSSSIELEYNIQECFNALTNKLDWNNLEGDHYPYDLTKHLPLQGESPNLIVSADYFFNNDLEYLKSSDLTKNYATSITKNKAARHEIKGIEDMKILSVVSVKVERLHGYGHLEEIVVKRADRQKYKFKEGDFVDLHLNDIKDMLLLDVQHKLFHIDEKDIVDFIVVVRIVYEELDKQPRLMQANELYKFSDGTLQAVCDVLHHRIRDFSLGFKKEMPLRKWSKVYVRRSKLMVELIDKQLLERRIIRNLERLVGAQELEMDHRLMQRTV
nr:hypothetical protein [Tanacetum cinerariifolium]